MKVVSWNVNYDDRAKDNYSVFSWENRKEMVCDFLKSIYNGLTVYHLQEVMPEYVEMLNNIFKETHDIFTQQVHPFGRQLYSAYPKSMKAKFIRVNRLSENHRQVFLKVKTVEDVIFINSHFPMGLKWRLDFSNQLTNIVDEKTVIVSGDFNTFSDEGGYEQLRIIQSKGGLYDTTNLMLHAYTGKRVLKSFSPYPYDILPESALNAPDFNLDHIFVKGDIFHSEPKVFDLKQIEFENKMYGVSDHYALLMPFNKK